MSRLPTTLQHKAMAKSVEPHSFELKNGRFVIIREADPSDAKELLVFVNRVGGESDYLAFGAGEFELTEAEEADFLSKCNAAETHIYLVAVIADEIIGTLHFSTARRDRFRHSGELGMSVSKQHWGQGIGSRLVEVLLEWAKQTNIVKKVNLRVRTDNQRAIQLYKSKGFQAEGTLSNEMYVGGSYYDLYAMGLNL